MNHLQVSQMSIQERLGYLRDTRLLIIHADDMGMSHSENLASIAVLEKGMVNSGSIMVPCPGFPEIAAYARTHPEVDLGIHLTLTSEWSNYKWGPVLPADDVPSLVDEQGFLFDGWEGFNQNAREGDVEQELRAQIQRAIASGIIPTHLDNHMLTLFLRPDFLKIYLKISREYKLPILLNKENTKFFNIDLDDYINETDVVVDNIFIAYPNAYEGQLENYYIQTMKSLPVGLNALLIHPAYNNEEMQGITGDAPYYGSAWRQQDFDFFTSDRCRQILHEEQIQLITWREIRDKLIDVQRCS